MPKKDVKKNSDEKQKKEVIEKLKYLVNKDVIKFVNKNKDRKDVQKCKKILGINDNKNINMKELEKKWKQSYSYDELEKLKNDIEGSCEEINKTIMYKDKRIYKIDKKNSKLISSLFNDVGKKIVKIENEYNEKIKLCGNDKELSDYYNETVRPFFYSFKAKMERVFEQLGIGVEGKQIYNNLIKQMFDLLKNFPDSLKYESVLEKKSKNFEDVENEFDKKYEKLMEEKLMEDFRELFKFEEERLEEFKDMTSELRKSGINVKGMVKNIEKSESFLKAAGNGGNPQKMQQVVNKITENNNEIQEDLTEICEKDKTSKGKSRLKRLKDWSKKFSKKLKIKKNKSKSKK